VLRPGYNGPRAPERQVAQATPRRVAIVGSYWWTAKEMNLSAFLEAADPISQNAGGSVDIVGEVPDSCRKACGTGVKATWFHGFVDNLSEFLAAGRMGVGRRGDGRRVQAQGTRLYLQSDKRQHGGLPLTQGLDYLSFGSMRALAQGVAAVTTAAGVSAMSSDKL